MAAERPWGATRSTGSPGRLLGRRLGAGPFVGCAAVFDNAKVALGNRRDFWQFFGQEAVLGNSRPRFGVGRSRNSPHSEGRPVCATQNAPQGWPRPQRSTPRVRDSSRLTTLSTSGQAAPPGLLGDDKGTGKGRPQTQPGFFRRRSGGENAGMDLMQAHAVDLPKLDARTGIAGRA